MFASSKYLLPGPVSLLLETLALLVVEGGVNGCEEGSKWGWVEKQDEILQPQYQQIVFYTIDNFDTNLYHFRMNFKILNDYYYW